jgi:hypothetical protein
MLHVIHELFCAGMPADAMRRQYHTQNNTSTEWGRVHINFQPKPRQHTIGLDTHSQLAKTGSYKITAKRPCNESKMVQA